MILAEHSLLASDDLTVNIDEEADIHTEQPDEALVVRLHSRAQSVTCEFI